MFNRQHKRFALGALDIIAKCEGGIWKRIDENRELREYLHEHAPGLLAQHPWIEGWLKSQDQFLSKLYNVAAQHLPNDYARPEFPRAWDETLGKWPAGVTPRLAEAASVVEREANRTYWETILDAFQHQAAVEGYEFTGEFTETILPEDVRERLGAAVLRARARLFSPLRSATDIEEYVKRNAADGDGIAWTDTLLDALVHAGLHISKVPNAVGRAWVDEVVGKFFEAIDAAA